MNEKGFFDVWFSRKISWSAASVQLKVGSSVTCEQVRGPLVSRGNGLASETKKAKNGNGWWWKGVYLGLV